MNVQFQKYEPKEEYVNKNAYSPIKKKKNQINKLGKKQKKIGL